MTGTDLEKFRDAIYSDLYRDFPQVDYLRGRAAQSFEYNVELIGWKAVPKTGDPMSGTTFEEVPAP